MKLIFTKYIIIQFAKAINTVKGKTQLTDDEKYYIKLTKPCTVELNLLQLMYTTKLWRLLSC